MLQRSPRLIATPFLILLSATVVPTLVRADEPLVAAAPPDVSTPAPDQPIEFNRDVRPILSDKCLHCHGPDKGHRQADLRLDVESGGRAVVVPHKLDESELWARVVSDDPEAKMPPPGSNRSLTPAQVDTLKRWIEQGGRWQQHWAYMPPERPATPALTKPEWAKNAVDSFIGARLEKEGLAPSPEAARATLLRRVTLDLTGLPPTPAELDAFENDSTPDAYERVVDRLLASPRYGERMALDWLDAARYADSNGYQSDRTRTLWPWRDWVVSAYNNNLPFDRFTVEQIAGDLLPNATREQRIATGFNRNHLLNGEGGRIPEESRVEYVWDRVDTTATVWLGSTLACSRCHDHKYDPFTQREYYEVYSYFNNIPESGSVDRGGNAAPIMRVPTDEQTQLLDELPKQIDDLEKQWRGLLDAGAWPKGPENLRARRFWRASIAPAWTYFVEVLKRCVTPTDEIKRLVSERQRLQQLRDDTNKAVVETMVMEEQPNPRETFVLVRGGYDNKGEKIDAPGVPTWLATLPAGAPNNRLGFAQWLVAKDNPLTARVAVNRAWQMFFGVGIVKTAEDFGVQGEPPVHPELLDWLAIEFVESGWDVKRLHKLLVMSAAYRQASTLRPELLERDPENRLVARGPRHRLSSLTLRDQALAVSGLLVEKLGGPPVFPYHPAGIWEEMSFNQIHYHQDHGEKLYRRSLYNYWRRTSGPPNFFDAATRQICAVKAVRTNTPIHALVLLNEPAYVEAARKLAERMLLEGGETVEARLDFGFRLCTSRHAKPEEIAVLKGSIERLVKSFEADPDAVEKLLAVGESPRDARCDAKVLAAYASVASVLLNLDEAICKE